MQTLNCNQTPQIKARLMNSTVERGISRIHAIIPPRIFGRVVFRYGFAVLSVAVALGTGLLVGQYHVPDVQFTLFLLAFALTTWYAGPGPGIVAFVLGSLAFNYFFTPRCILLVLLSLKISRTTPCSCCSGRFWCGSVPFGGGSSTIFDNLATNSRRK